MRCKNTFSFHKRKLTKPLQGFRGRGAEPHSAKRKSISFVKAILSTFKKRLRKTILLINLSFPPFYFFDQTFFLKESLNDHRNRRY